MINQNGLKLVDIKQKNSVGISNIISLDKAVWEGSIRHASLNSNKKTVLIFSMLQQISSGV